MQTINLSMKNPKNLSPNELSNLIQQNAVNLIDVREYPEFAAKRIAGARLVPLSQLQQSGDAAPLGDSPVMICRSGSRSAQAVDVLKRRGVEASQLAGGLDAWEKQGLPLETNSRAPWAIERQVRFIAGLLILAGLGLSKVWEPAIGLAWLVPAGLVLAALTDSCMMGILLSKLPWNRPPMSCSTAQG
jgi:rhodanese-related sulfurtransferase